MNSKANSSSQLKLTEIFLSIAGILDAVNSIKNSTYMALWRLYYHLIWATKERQPLITPERETQLYSYIIGKANTLGSIIHAVDGIENHIHLVASIPPRFSISDFVQNLKGSSAHHLNHLSPSRDLFGWQRGYGVFSMGSKQLEQAVVYVQNQKAHHSNGNMILSLEQHNHEDDGPKLTQLNQ